MGSCIVLNKVFSVEQRARAVAARPAAARRVRHGLPARWQRDTRRVTARAQLDVCGYSHTVVFAKGRCTRSFGSVAANCSCLDGQRLAQVLVTLQGSAGRAGNPVRSPPRARAQRRVCLMAKGKDVRMRAKYTHAESKLNKHSDTTTSTMRAKISTMNIVRHHVREAIMRWLCRKVATVKKVATFRHRFPRLAGCRCQRGA